MKVIEIGEQTEQNKKVLISQFYRVQNIIEGER